MHLKLFYSDLNILVTGGTGFIGSYITEKLVNLGANVTVLSRTANPENLVAVKDKVNFIKGNIKDFNTCLEATKNKDIAFHLAAFISASDSIANPLECQQTNIGGTYNMLEACRQNNVERFILSSSAAVYGSTDKLCQEDNICNPESPYGYSKLIGEELCQQYSRFYNLKTLCLRYFNVFGDRQNPNGAYAAVVAKFKDSLKNNAPITIFGDGQQTRDFVPVQKIAEANIMLATLNDQLNGQPVNVASGNSINIIELFELLKLNYPDYTQALTFKPARVGDPKNSFADNSKLKKMLQLSSITKL